MVFSLTHSCRVYPRSRGGTTRCRADPVNAKGLSPLARGNPQRLGQQRFARGSIPARAGEPSANRAGFGVVRVYPRSRGGTAYSKTSELIGAGLSPLARGNLDKIVRRLLSLGSIPARAGEPERMARNSARMRVYPRSRGGTQRRQACIARLLGLSPLARGNQKSESVLTPALGSIPARAGEPKIGKGKAIRTKVYPRSRGGTAHKLKQARAKWGLSPLARGNLRSADCGAAYGGSIPARAGEPKRTQSAA